MFGGGITPVILGDEPTSTQAGMLDGGKRPEWPHDAPPSPDDRLSDDEWDGGGRLSRCTVNGTETGIEIVR